MPSQPRFNTRPMGSEWEVLITKLDIFTFCTLFIILSGICVCGMPQGCIVLWVFTAKSLLPFFVSKSVRSVFSLDSLHA
ncbi:hypothetical protein DPMN_020069 [Dreissena polymorpha]|uniref:Uncharacterized protein n=1 Tax=Dreissena polymorpha TaxID=45954 RepID=A0A9D4NM17_DREPO|nr:hypothetical protein DPMN_020069 [Dreissena polymorpha]